MAVVNNSLAVKPKATGISAFMSGPAVKTWIEDTIGKTNSQRFVTSVVSAVNVNPALKECDSASIVSAALLGESLNLPPSPQLGYFYMVPFNNKTGKQAQFQMGYKGMIQLAIRTGQYKRINVVAIKEGELEFFDPLNEEIKVNLMVDDWDKREKLPTIGYYAFFELVNGYRKSMYWSKSQMEAHALRYSKGYSAKKGYTFWEKNFDQMAYKTMLRQLLSKWGIMSTEMTRAYEMDMSVSDGNKVEYPEPEAMDIEYTTEEPIVEEVKAEPQQASFF